MQTTPPRRNDGEAQLTGEKTRGAVSESNVTRRFEGSVEKRILSRYFYEGRFLFWCLLPPVIFKYLSYCLLNFFFRYAEVDHNLAGW